MIGFFVAAFVMAVNGCDGSGSDSTPSPPADDGVAQDLTALANEVSTANGGRAAILYVETPDHVWQTTSGLADVAGNTPATIEDRVEIGSASKMFLAVTLLRLAEEGRLSLEDPLTQWFDQAVLDTLTGGNGSKLLLRHLMSHATGMGDHLNFAPDETVLQTYGVTGEQVYMPQDLLDNTLAITLNPVDENYDFPWFTLQDANGASYADYDSVPNSAYSNTGYIMLGMIVEAVTGLRYEDVIQQQILDPLDMGDTVFGTNDAQATLTGYALGLDISGENPVRTSPTLSWSAGQMISTTADMARFLSVAMTGGLFAQEKTLEMWKTQYFKPLLYLEARYGLGLYKINVDGVGTVYGHDGQVFGAVALMAYDAATGNIYTAAVNNSQYVSVDNDPNASIWELVRKIHDIVVVAP
jgi:D-alanyl-D-alanine carboxypeptidase